MDITVNTGYGYVKDESGKPISKCELPIGKTILADGYTYVECNTKESMVLEFDALRKTPEEVAQEEAIIATEIAIETFKKTEFVTWEDLKREIDKVFPDEKQNDVLTKLAKGIYIALKNNIE